MVKKSILAFVAFFILFESFLRLGLISSKWVTSGQNLWANNVVKAQHFLYEFNTQNYNCVIGSSISYKLVDEILPNNLYVLSFNGLSVHDGLFVLKKNKKLPDTLFVETNVLERPNNEEFSEKIGRNKVEVELKRYILGLRTAYTPINLLTQIAASGIVVLKRKFGIKEDNHAAKEAIDLMRKLEVKGTKQKKNKNQAFVHESDLTNHLFSILQLLHEKGTIIVLFDMPVDCGLEKKHVYYNTLYNKGEESGFLSMKRVPCTDYNTSDGTHLDGSSAIKYTEYFLRHRNSSN